MAIKYLDAKRIRGLSSDTKPTNVPDGTLFEETDTYKVYWRGDSSWAAEDKTIGCNCVGDDGGNSSLIDYCTIDTAGDADTWGDVTQGRFHPACFADATKGIIAGGGISASQNTIDYFLVAVPATNATDWGDLGTGVRHNTGIGDETTYGLSCAGIRSSATNVIVRITIATTGISNSFGTTAANLASPAGCSDKTRGLLCGGYEY